MKRHYYIDASHDADMPAISLRRDGRLMESTETLAKNGSSIKGLRISILERHPREARLSACCRVPLQDRQLDDLFRP